MIDSKELSELADLCKHFEDKYLKPTKAYTESLKAKYGANPTQRQQDEIILAQNKAADIERLIYLTRKSTGWLAAMMNQAEKLDKLNVEKRIIKNGTLNIVFDEQKKPLLEIIQKLLAFVKEE